MARYNTTRDEREKYLRILLYIAFAVLFFWCGLTHIFFKEFYFNDVFGVEFNVNDSFDNEASEIIGVLCIALAYGAFLAARNPRENANMIRVLIAAAIGCSLVFLYNILAGNAPISLLFNVVFCLVTVVALVILYPGDKLLFASDFKFKKEEEIK